MSRKSLGAFALIATVGAGLGAELGAGPIAAATSSRADAAASTRTVILHRSVYSPSVISIHRGDTVKWVWAPGKVLHNVIGHSFRSRTVTHGSYSLRFTRAGSYSYTCTVHPGMNGRVLVH